MRLIMMGMTTSSGQSCSFYFLKQQYLKIRFSVFSSQVEWFVQTSESVQPILRPYSPPVMIDETFEIHDRRQEEAQRELKRPNAYVSACIIIFNRH
jgi:hypothetical protein